MTAMPYVVGQWVRGERFYGRRSQIAEILYGHRDAIWLLGEGRLLRTSFIMCVLSFTQLMTLAPFSLHSTRCSCVQPVLT